MKKIFSILVSGLFTLPCFAQQKMVVDINAIMSNRMAKYVIESDKGDIGNPLVTLRWDSFVLKGACLRKPHVPFGATVSKYTYIDRHEGSFCYLISDYTVTAWAGVRSLIPDYVVTLEHRKTKLTNSLCDQQVKHTWTMVMRSINDPSFSFEKDVLSETIRETCGVQRFGGKYDRAEYGPSPGQNVRALNELLTSSTGHTVKP